MSLFQALVLGVVQGLTEFIPISSSAHLLIVPWLFGWPDPGLAFDAALHLGTLVAVFGYFWRDLIGLVVAGVRSLTNLRRALREDAQARLAWLLVIGTIPAVVAGALFEGPIDALFHEQFATAVFVVAGLLALLGGLLWLAERLAQHTRGVHDLRWLDGILIGLAQALALLPGVSRSGSTITAGLALGLKRDDAARFSFLLSAPVVLGAGVKALYDAARGGLLAQEPLAFALGFVAAAVAGYAAIEFLLRYLRRASTLPFIYYRWALAVLLVIVALARAAV